MSKNLKSVITCDLDGKIETFSSGAQDMFGYTEDEIIGKGRVSDFSAGQIVLGVWSAYSSSLSATLSSISK